MDTEELIHSDSIRCNRRQRPGGATRQLCAMAVALCSLVGATQAPALTFSEFLAPQTHYYHEPDVVQVWSHQYDSSVLTPGRVYARTDTSQAVAVAYNVTHVLTTAGRLTYNHSGELLKLDTSDKGTDIAVDASGYLYITGGSDLTVYKKAPDGTRLWMSGFDRYRDDPGAYIGWRKDGRGYPVYGKDEGRKLLLDESGGTYVLGMSEYCGIPDSICQRQSVLAHFDAAGVRDWFKIGQGEPVEIKRGPFGNLLMLTTAGHYKVSPAGVELCGNIGPDARGRAVAFSARGDYYIANGGQGSWVYSPIHGYYISPDFNLRRYDANCVMHWFQKFDNGGDEYAMDVVVNPAGTVIVGGEHCRDRTPAPHQQTCLESDYLLVAYDENGQMLWTTSATPGSRRNALMAMRLERSGDHLLATGNKLLLTPISNVETAEVHTIRVDTATGAIVWSDSLSLGSPSAMYPETFVDIDLNAYGYFAITANGASSNGLWTDSSDVYTTLYRRGKSRLDAMRESFRTNTTIRCCGLP